MGKEKLLESFNNTNVDEESFDEKLLTELQKICEKEKSFPKEFLDISAKRLSVALKNKRTTKEDNILIGLVGRFSEHKGRAWDNAVLVCIEVLKHFLNSRFDVLEPGLRGDAKKEEREQKIADYMQELSVIVLENLPKYDGTICGFEAFVRGELQNAIFRTYQDTHNVYGSKYTEKTTRYIKRAEDYFLKTRNTLPTDSEIVDWINETYNPKDPMTITKIEKARNTMLSNAEFDEAYMVADINGNPEKELMAQAFKEEIWNLTGDRGLDDEVKEVLHGFLSDEDSIPDKITAKEIKALVSAQGTKLSLRSAQLQLDKLMCMFYLKGYGKKEKLDKELLDFYQTGVLTFDEMDEIEEDIVQTFTMEEIYGENWRDFDYGITG